MSHCPAAAYSFEGHDWEISADQRWCRRCGARESRGSMGECYNGHDWSYVTCDLERCRRCGAENRRNNPAAGN